MHISEYKQESKYFPKRCQRKVRQQPTVGSIPEHMENCRHIANFKIDDALYCRQHAGELSLIYLLDNQKAT